MSAAPCNNDFVEELCLLRKTVARFAARDTLLHVAQLLRERGDLAAHAAVLDRSNEIIAQAEEAA